jgi:N6-L-threonylcarbamoyladenine synthase
MMEEECRRNCIKLYYPEPVLCTDNGAMIACAAYYKYRRNGADGLDLDCYPYLEFQA